MDGGLKLSRSAAQFEGLTYVGNVPCFKVSKILDIYWREADGVDCWHQTLVCVLLDIMALYLPVCRYRASVISKPPSRSSCFGVEASLERRPWPVYHSERPQRVYSGM